MPSLTPSIRSPAFVGLLCVAAISLMAACSSGGAGVVCDAIATGDVARVKAALAAGPVDLLRQQGKCQPVRNALDRAAQHPADGLAMLQAMFQAGLDPNASFSISASNRSGGRSTTTTLGLIEYAAIDPDGIEGVRLLLKAGADRKSVAATAALNRAAGDGRLDLVRLLVEQGVPAVPVNGETALDAAVSERHHAVIAFLQAHGAREAPSGHLALHRAARLGDVAALRAALASGNQVDQPDLRDQSALFKAAGFGQAEAAALLLSAGADPNRLHDGRSALHAVAAEGHAPLVPVLVRGGAKLDAQAAEAHGTPLVVAVMARREAAVAALLQAGAKTNLASPGGTPLELAVQQRHLGLVRLLLAAKADPNGGHAASDGSILHLAVTGCEAPDFDLDLLRALIAAGARPGALDAQGRTARQRLAEAIGKETRPFYKACHQARADLLQANGG